MRVALRSAALVSALFASNSADAASAVADDRPDIVRLARGDPEIATAVRQALGRLDAFLAFAADPSATTSDFSLKIGLPLNEKDVEYVWVRPFQRTGEEFVGRLLNEPRDFPGLKYGQRIQFDRANIIDFAYRESGQLKGHFTTCVLLRRIPAAQRAEVLAANPIACEP